MPFKSNPSATDVVVIQDMANNGLGAQTQLGLLPANASIISQLGQKMNVQDPAFSGLMVGGSANFEEVYSNGVASAASFTLSDGADKNISFNAIAAGTVYTMTASQALIDFGTTDPTITIANAGTYLIWGFAHLKLNAATITNQTATVKMRRTNNTATDLTGGTTTAVLPIATTSTLDGGYLMTPVVVYTATAGDIISLFGALSGAAGAGTVTCVEANICAIRISA